VRYITITVEESAYMDLLAAVRFLSKDKPRTWVDATLDKCEKAYQTGTVSETGLGGAKAPGLIERPRRGTGGASRLS
jgi:hypothetical protein